MSKPNANPFFQADFSKFPDLSKLMGDYKLPAPNMEAVMSAQRRNLEAFTALGQSAFESMQALARRQGELMRDGIQEATNLMNTVMSAPSPEEKVIRQAEASKAAVEKCIANARDISETLTKCNQQAMETVSTRLNEGIEELRGIIKQSADTRAA